MDRSGSAAGRAGHALLLDCRSLESTLAPLPEGVALVICDTSSPRRLDSSAYNERRAECEEGVRLLVAGVPGIRALRDVQPGDVGPPPTGPVDFPRGGSDAGTD